MCLPLKLTHWALLCSTPWLQHADQICTATIQLQIQHTPKSAAAKLGLTLAELVEINGCIHDQLERLATTEGFNRRDREDQELTKSQHLIEPTRSSNNSGYLLQALCWWPRVATYNKTAPAQIQVIQDPQAPQIQRQVGSEHVWTFCVPPEVFPKSSGVATKSLLCPRHV